MLSLDGIDYTLKTPEENVSDLIAYINDYCQVNGIRNSYGEIINIDVNETNPLYMVCYGLSYLTSILQRLVYSAGCSISIPESSERQLLNIADAAGVKRNAATKTVIQGTIYSNLEDAGAVDCVITQSLTATVVSGTYSIAFHPAYDMVIPIGESRQIMLIAEDYGAFNVSENTVTAFDDVVPGFRMMTTRASTPGQDQESISSLRARLQRRSVEGTQADRCAEAIQELDGVSLCNIYFNYSPEATVTVGSRAIPVPPRTALLMVQGYSPDIAKTFYRYLICQTAGGDLPASYGVYTQDFVTKAGQVIPVYILPPQQAPVYIKIYVYETLAYSQIEGIKDAVASLSSSLTIGQSITTKMVLDVLSENYSDITFQGAEISADDVAYSYKATPNNDEVFIFNLGNIKVIEVQ